MSASLAFRRNLDCLSHSVHNSYRGHDRSFVPFDFHHGIRHRAFIDGTGLALTTLGRHPLALLRDRMARDRLQSAEQLATLRSGQLARACGLVTVRQRPGTANGVLFMTLEDETGQVNVILWPGLLEKFRKEALGASLLAVYGVLAGRGKGAAPDREQAR